MNNIEEKRKVLLKRLETEHGKLSPGFCEIVAGLIEKETDPVKLDGFNKIITESINLVTQKENVIPGTNIRYKQK